MNSIKRHTAELRKERLSKKRAGIPERNHFHLNARLNTTASNLTSVFSDMDSVINMAKMRGAGSSMGLQKGGWRVTSKAPQKPYQPILRDVYPRNEYTMMPEYNAPKYYTGHFMKYDYKDAPKQPSGEYNDGRPVVFKKQDIENVQTKKKYGGNPKGQSSVPLHLCNDTSSLLYRRSLQPSTLDKIYLPSTGSPTRASSTLTYPYALHKHVKNEQSALHPLVQRDPIQTWLDTKYPSGERNHLYLSTAGSSSTEHGHRNRLDVGLRSGRARSEPEWFSEFFPRQKVADTMKFMGSAKQSTQSKNSKEYDVNFKG